MSNERWDEIKDLGKFLLKGILISLVAGILLILGILFFTTRI